MGLSDLPHLKSVKLYCAKCEDIYNPKSSRHAAIDGAYFGASFHNILFQVYPTLIPEKSRRRYEPRIFGFRVHAAAALARWQDNDREMMKRRLRAVGRDGESNTVENVGFVEDGSSEGEEELEEDELGLAGGRENGDGEMEEIQQSVQGA
jgi:casein kinase II subunit beta